MCLRTSHKHNQYDLMMINLVKSVATNVSREDTKVVQGLQEEDYNEHSSSKDIFKYLIKSSLKARAAVNS